MRVQQGQVNAAAAEFLTDTPMDQRYHRVAPRPEDVPRLLDKIAEAMATNFDFTEEVRGLQVPTLIVAADADMAPPSHYVEVFELLDGGLRDGGWMGEGPRAVTRWRSCPASPTTTWASPRCSRRPHSPSSTNSRAERPWPAGGPGLGVEQCQVRLERMLLAAGVGR
jgi:hypothetical protein